MVKLSPHQWSPTLFQLDSNHDHRPHFTIQRGRTSLNNSTTRTIPACPTISYGMGLKARCGVASGLGLFSGCKLPEFRFIRD
ncbi:unnamed protein product [Penicillium camemberti]|uniref:Str. FM013 n=1 Tax=Penicillium camemberti (strain FM 013) TaxID=1429867 RepID=A0A0G4PDY9_PENC3|nr:unnamed protein product [Penicillium camemberti]